MSVSASLAVICILFIIWFFVNRRKSKLLLKVTKKNKSKVAVINVSSENEIVSDQAKETKESTEKKNRNNSSHENKITFSSSDDEFNSKDSRRKTEPSKKKIQESNKHDESTDKDSSNKRKKETAKNSENQENNVQDSKLTFVYKGKTKSRKNPVILNLLCLNQNQLEDFGQIPKEFLGDNNFIKKQQLETPNQQGTNKQINQRNNFTEDRFDNNDFKKTSITEIAQKNSENLPIPKEYTQIMNKSNQMIQDSQEKAARSRLTSNSNSNQREPIIGQGKQEYLGDVKNYTSSQDKKGLSVDQITHTYMKNGSRTRVSFSSDFEKNSHNNLQSIPDSRSRVKSTTTDGTRVYPYNDDRKKSIIRYKRRSPSIQSRDLN